MTDFDNGVGLASMSALGRAALEMFARSARWLADRQEAEPADLSESERRAMGAARRDIGVDVPAAEDAEARAARGSAVGAWVPPSLELGPARRRAA